MKMLKFLFGFVAGLGTGWVIGTLVAPEEGSELRGSLRRKLNVVIEEGRRAAEARRAELEAQFQSATRVQPAGAPPAEKAHIA